MAGRRRARWIVLVVLHLAVAGALLCFHGPLVRMDHRVEAHLARTSDPRLAWCCLWVMQLGSLGVVWRLGVVVGVGLIYLRRWRELVAWCLALAGGGVLVEVLKALFQRAKPPLLVASAGFSFPSGHTMGATLTYGMVAVLVTRGVKGRWVGVVAGVLAAAAIAGTGFGLVYTRCHWVTDVVGGYLAGAAWLAVCGWGVGGFWEGGSGGPPAVAGGLLRGFLNFSFFAFVLYFF